MTTYRDGQWFATLYTCNYGPNGNVISYETFINLTFVHKEILSVAKCTKKAEVVLNVKQEHNALMNIQDYVVGKLTTFN